jgi:hypothetical protein
MACLSLVVSYRQDSGKEVASLGEFSSCKCGIFYLDKIEILF